MAVRLYRLLLTSAAVMIGALTATILVSGGWQAVAIAIALTAGSAVLTAVMALGVMAEAAEPVGAALQRPRGAEQPKAALEREVRVSTVAEEPAVAAAVGLSASDAVVGT
jgi:hypothetical protein